MRSKGIHRPVVRSPTETLGAVMRERRKALGINQSELAALAGVGLAFLYELEHGKATVRVDKVLAVLDVLGLELHVRQGRERVSVADALREAPP